MGKGKFIEKQISVPFDWRHEVGVGNVPNNHPVRKFGRNPAVVL